MVNAFPGLDVSRAIRDRRIGRPAQHGSQTATVLSGSLLRATSRGVFNAVVVGITAIGLSAVASISNVLVANFAAVPVAAMKFKTIYPDDK
jgi:hypothetical protein